MLFGGTVAVYWENRRSRSYFTTDGRSVSQSACLGVEPTLGLVTRYYFLVRRLPYESRGLVSVGRPL
jgi:hypothetical protein